MPSRYGSTRTTHVHFGTADNSSDRAQQGGRRQFQHSVLGNSQHVGARFGHFQALYPQVEYKREPGTGPQIYLITKNLNKCSNDTFCLMAVPPIGRQKAKRNRIIYMHV